MFKNFSETYISRKLTPLKKITKIDRDRNYLFFQTFYSKTIRYDAGKTTNRQEEKIPSVKYNDNSKGTLQVEEWDKI